MLFRCRQVDMLNIMPRGHDAADRPLIQIKHPLDHPSFLRVEDQPVAVIGQHGGGFGIQLRILFLTA